MVDKKVIAIAAVAILAIAGVSAFMVVGNNDDGPKADTDFAGKNLEVVDNLDGGIVAVGQDSFRWMTYFGLADKCVMVDQNDMTNYLGKSFMYTGRALVDIDGGNSAKLSNEDAARAYQALRDGHPGRFL
ncbi:hypothetical protein [Methanomethylophilus alvi]|uniref:hypothetical protein n=1 Tax=Methanomethylophilus alvi TaxID=1291540 RepID=UPI0037DD9275